MGKRYKTDDVSLGIGNRIRELRLKTRRPDGKKMNQEEFYGFLGCDTGRTNNSNQGRQSELENAVQPPVPAELIALSQKCGVSIDWILTGKEAEGHSVRETDNRVSQCCRELVHIDECCEIEMKDLEKQNGFGGFSLIFPTSLHEGFGRVDYDIELFNTAIYKFLQNYYGVKALPIDNDTKVSLIETLYTKADEYKSQLDKKFRIPF